MSQNLTRSVKWLEVTEEPYCITQGEFLPWECNRFKIEPRFMTRVFWLWNYKLEVHCITELLPPRVKRFKADSKLYNLKFECWNWIGLIENDIVRCKIGLLLALNLTWNKNLAILLFSKGHNDNFKLRIEVIVIIIIIFAIPLCSRLGSNS